MLAENVCVDVLLADRVVFRESRTQTRRVENRTRTDDLALRQTGNFIENISKDIDRIAYDDICSVRCVAGNLRNNLFRDIDIGLRKVKTGLTRVWRAIPEVTITMSEFAASR